MRSIVRLVVVLSGFWLAFSPYVMAAPTDTERRQKAQGIVRWLEEVALNLQRGGGRPNFSPTMDGRQTSDFTTWFRMGINRRSKTTVALVTPAAGSGWTCEVRIKDMVDDTFRCCVVSLTLSGIGETQIISFQMLTLTKANDPDRWYPKSHYRIAGSWDKVPPAESEILMPRPRGGGPVVQNPFENKTKVDLLMPVGARVSRIATLDLYETRMVTTFLYFVEVGDLDEACQFFALTRRQAVRWLQGAGARLLARTKDQFDVGQDAFYLERIDEDHFVLGHGDESPVLRFKLVWGQKPKVVEILRSAVSQD